MNYSLSKPDVKKEKDKGVLLTAWRRLVPLMKEERRAVLIALLATLVNCAVALVVPIMVSHVVDTYILAKDFSGVVWQGAVLFVIFIAGLVASYVQVKTMGGVGRRLLFNLRNKIFDKLQELPVAFFNENKAGDLISRINNDTDKLNQFFSQALVQFAGNLILIFGSGVLLLVLEIRLGFIALIPAILAIIATQLFSPWVKRTSLKSLQTLGAMSGEIQESINNFKVIVAFNRLDYFRDKFKESNQVNYQASVMAGIASNVFNPIYLLASSMAQLLVLAWGIYFISQGNFTIGLLIGFFLYVNSFYNPLRQLATVWPSLQLALAGLDRISEVLSMKNNMELVIDQTAPDANAPVIEFRDVFFHYVKGTDVLKNINVSLERGKTYALVGPTGGGKTTIASLMARLYDPISGTIYLEGKDIRSYAPVQRAKKIGFILQEPFLFNGSVRENILYGNEEYKDIANNQVITLLQQAGLDGLMARFPEGLDTRVTSSTDAVSLGQKQLIAFIRAVLRRPDILILDEATANIDTVTEQLLQEIIGKLPATTTKVIIAHRLNTIENADEIFFVNGGQVVPAGSMQHAVEMLLKGNRKS